jgi:secreted trypsin-like serine protease
MKALTLKEAVTILSLILVGLGAAGCNPNADLPAGSIATADTGIAETIIGGSIVDAGESIAQSTVLLVDTDKGALCTGNLIGANLVLTAAHCTQRHPENILVVFSRKMPKSSADLQKMVTRRISGGKTTSAWPNLTVSKKKDWGDLAILKFSGSLPSGYKVVKLLADARSLRNGMTVTLAGYGITDGVNQTDTDALRKVDVRLSNSKWSQTEILMDQRSGRGACHGDSGGPAIVKNGSSDVLAGVTSRGERDPRDTCSGYAVYTSVASNLNWIKATAQEVGSPNFRGGEIAQPIGMD